MSQYKIVISYSFGDKDVQQNSKIDYFIKAKKCQ